MISISFCTILLTSYTARGQLLEQLLPWMANPIRDLAGNITQTPEDNVGGIIDGEVVSYTVRFVNSLSHGIALSFAPYKNVISLLENNSQVTSSTHDSFVRDYNLARHNEDCRLSCHHQLEKYGHSVEIHEPVTEDGYVLKLLRIPSDGPAVFLMHGLHGSSDDFIAAGPDSAIAYLLANEGYDVWLGNARGTKHCERHLHMNTSQEEFWDFSWHEIGYYDVPAMIDYALNVTRQNKLKYIGYSQGNTGFWVMCSERPEYNDKVSVMIALAPIAFMYNTKSPFFISMKPMFRILDFQARVNRKIRARKMCGGTPLECFLCINMLLLITGFNIEWVSATRMPVILSHAPSGCSFKQSLHYSQGILTGKFRKFDYGVTENMKQYGTRIPPDYKVANVRVPVVLIYGNNDWLSDERDVETLSNQLPNLIDAYKIEGYTHIDYVYGKNAKDIIYPRVRKWLSKY